MCEMWGWKCEMLLVQGSQVVIMNMRETAYNFLHDYFIGFSIPVRLWMVPEDMGTISMHKIKNKNIRKSVNFEWMPFQRKETSLVSEPISLTVIFECTLTAKL